MKKLLIENTLILWIAALTLGLAPFNPPHIYDKILWLSGGAKGMQAMDYFDVIIHGAPWILLIIAYVMKFIYRGGTRVSAKK